MEPKDLVWIIPTIIALGFFIVMSFKARRKDFPVFRGPGDFLCAFAVPSLIIADIVIYNEYIANAGFSGNPAIAFAACAVGAVVCFALTIFLAVKNSDRKGFGVLIGIYRISLIAVAIAIVVLVIAIKILWTVFCENHYYCTKCGRKVNHPDDSNCPVGGKHSFRSLHEN